MKVNLSDGLYREKYFGGYIWFDQFYSHILNLTYDRDYDFSRYEQGLSEDGKLKIRQMAKELVIRYKVGRNSINKLFIYGFNPNTSYSLVYGKNIGRIMGFDLITDGEVETIDYPDRVGKEHLYYESPLNYNERLQLKNPKVAIVKIKNATYTIKQAICEGKIRYCKVNTQLLDEEKLNGIVAIANQNYENGQYALIDKEPYVRKLILK